MRRLGAAVTLLLVPLTIPSFSRADEEVETPAPNVETAPVAGDSEGAEPPHKLPWNEFDWKYSTFRFGYGLVVDFADYGQDAASKQQFTMDNGDVGLRDFRLLFKGKFKTQRPFSWTLGYMYDGADGEWHFRQTGIEVGIPEWHGRIFIGRTK